MWQFLHSAQPVELAQPEWAKVPAQVDVFVIWELAKVDIVDRLHRSSSWKEVCVWQVKESAIDGCLALHGSRTMNGNFDFSSITQNITSLALAMGASQNGACQL